MNDKRDFDRAVDRWLDDGSDATPPEVIDAVLLAVRSTPQERRSWWPAWRTNRLNTYAKLIVASAAVLVVAIGVYQFLPGRSGFGGTNATSSPSPALLARGTFELHGAEVQLDATGAGDSVTGTMAVSHPDGDFTVDLKCTRTTEDGRILIAGDITDSTSPYARKGAREVLVLKPGSPVVGGFDSEGRPGSGLAPAASCQALLEAVMDLEWANIIGEGALEPIEETVEFGPTLLARGNFVTNVGEVVELEATREGSSVTGRMAVSAQGQNEPYAFIVDLECARTTEDGLIMIGGVTTNSTGQEAPQEGSWAGIVLERGSPVGASTWQLESQAASCLAFLDEQLMLERSTHLEPVDFTDPLEGTVELGP